MALPFLGGPFTGQINGVPVPPPATPSFVYTVDGLNGAITLAELGLDQVTNTSDANKPVSTAQAVAIAAAQAAAVATLQPQVTTLNENVAALSSEYILD